MGGRPHGSDDLVGTGSEAARPSQRAAPESDRDDDLADLLVRLQVAVSLDDLIKRERLGDQRLEAAFGESVVDELLRPFQTLAGRS